MSDEPGSAKNKTVLVTGASSGLGRATALHFLKRGWNVAATMRNAQAASREGDWPEDPRLARLQLDVTDEASVERAVGQVLERFGRIDVVVNNAGYGLNGVLEGLPSPVFELLLKTHVVGAASVIRQVLPVMRKQGSGTIVNISSVAGRIGFPVTAGYCAAKFGLEGLSEALRFELRPFGIRVKIVEPGGMKTDFFTRSMVWAEHPVYAKMIAHVRTQTNKIGAIAKGPDRVAKEIYRAASSTSGRLRYSANANAIFLTRAVLPDALWRWLLDKALIRN